MRKTLASTIATLAFAGGIALADGVTDRAEPLPGGRLVADVNFAFDDTAVRAAGSDELDRAAAAMFAEPDALVVLDGHTDATGDEVYNTGLAIRRAESVKDGLAARGIDPDRIVIAVYGENTADGRAGRAERRVDVWLTSTVSVGDIVDRTLVAGDAVVWTTPLTERQIEQTPRLTASR